MDIRTATRQRNLGRLREALARGDPNEREWGEAPPLHDAVRAHWPTGVEALLEAGADPGATDRFGRTAYHVAVEEDIHSLRRLLDPEWLRRDALEAQANEFTPLDLAFRLEKRAFIQALLDAGADPRPPRDLMSPWPLADAASNTARWDLISMLQ